MLNSVIQGDCVEILKKIPDKSVDLIIADPPYYMGPDEELCQTESVKIKGYDGDWDKFASVTEYGAFCHDWISECRRVLRDTGSIWVVGSGHTIFRMGTIMLNLGFWILNNVTWYKDDPLTKFSETRFTDTAETLLWCSKGKECKKYTFNYNMMKKYNGGKQMISVWRIGACGGEERIRNGGKKAYLTRKPEELLKRIILSSTKKGELVLDPFFGNGATGIGAKKLKRNYIGIEEDKKYAALAKRRINGTKGFYKEAGWIDEKKEKQLRVPFETLVKKKLIRAGELLHSKKTYKTTVFVFPDGRLRYKNETGSIHRIGAAVQKTPSCNGWKFWHVKRGGRMILIDELRKEYLKAGGK